MAKVNGVDVDALKQVTKDVAQDPSKGIVKFHVTSSWNGSGPKSTSRVKSYYLGGEEIPRDFSLSIDEPKELLGTNTAPNPQEVLMAAFNACTLATFVAACAVKGVELAALRIETEGGLDLRGFLGIDPSVKPGYEELHCTVKIKGRGTQEQFKEVLQTVLKTSPNYWNMANPVKVKTDLVVE
jgi:uncharacterized OsmC-like protein